jgi:hypothetical protein
MVAADGHEYREMADGCDASKRISAARCLSRLNAILCGTLEITGSPMTEAQFEHRAFSVAGRRVVGYFGQSNAGAVTLSPLLLAICLVVTPHAVKFGWERECENGIAGPLNKVHLPEEACVSRDGCQFAGQNSKARV